MAQYSNILIIGERVLLLTMSCATLVFEKTGIYQNAPWRVESIETLRFIVNKSGINILIDKFGLGLNGEVLTHKFTEHLINKYGEERVEQIL